MTKQEMIDKINNVPDDILGAAYAFDIIQSNQIQMTFNPIILSEYRGIIGNIHVDNSGYLCFSINGQEVCMT